MQFTKMHGSGNDYVYIDCTRTRLKDAEKFAVRVSDRHFGIGADGLILICPSDIADFRMRMYNADGSESRMCGNGIRCVGKYVYDKGLHRQDTVRIETASGVKILQLHIEHGVCTGATVDMGEPVLIPRDIPALLPDLNARRAIEIPVMTQEHDYLVTAVSMGNPHAVIFFPEVETVEALDLSKLGPPMERHPMFPERANIEFVAQISPTKLRMRVWERGTGETMACGTGACAALVAATLTGRVDRRAEIVLDGGSLDIHWDQATNHVMMTGPAEISFEGSIEP